MRDICNEALRRMLLALAMVGALGATSNQSAQNKPAAFIAIERARSVERLRKGHIEWTRETRVGEKTVRRHYTSRFAGEDSLLVDRGDDEGVVMRMADGTPATYTFTGPRQFLTQGDSLWFRVAQSRSATVYHREHQEWSNVRNMRIVGLNPWIQESNFYERLQANGVPNISYSAKVEDGLHIVEAVNGPVTAKWWIDSNKGWNPVRSQTIGAKGVIWENRISLRKYGDVWYPETVARFPDGYKNGAEPSQIIHINSAVFNTADLPDVLSVADIGLEVGMGVTFHDKGGSYRSLYWDGDKAVPWGELAPRLKSGELRTGPTLLAIRARATGNARAQTANGSGRGKITGKTLGQEPRKPFETEWEAYTRRFIAKFGLNDDQSAKAMTILKRCQDQAASYATRMERAFEKLESDLGRLKESGEALGSPAAQKLAFRKEKLRRPIDAIFERQLKPGLEKLPTRAQRAAAGKPQKKDNKRAEGKGKP